MRVTQLMLIVLMSGFALAACKSKPPTLPDASNAPEQTGAETNRTGDTDVSGRGLPADEQAKQAAQTCLNHRKRSSEWLYEPLAASSAAISRSSDAGSGRSCNE
jgi:predicted small lipoprotein YifL